MLKNYNISIKTTFTQTQNVSANSLDEAIDNAASLLNPCLSGVVDNDRIIQVTGDPSFKFPVILIKNIP
jgi:hypothetical protein